ncbi:MAG TPA: hypothetical protein VMD79_15055 [Solirubrobacteraceae bacterium]|nr:hypothetical protein [Solirubrobacteraceae bacterium]
MDLALFLAVLWRSKRLLGVGVLFAVILAVLAYGKPGISNGAPSLTPRGAEVWQSESQLLITQAGYPYGQGVNSVPGNLAQLSPVYATLANGNQVQAEIRQQLGTSGTVKASEALDLGTSSGLPFVNLVASAPSSSDAMRLAAGAAVIFRSYVARQQAAERIPASQRVQLSIVASGTKAKLAEGHKLSVPILVFVAVLIGFISMVFLKENLRSRAAKELELQRARTAASPQMPEVPQMPEAPQPHHEDASTNGGDAGVYREPVKSGDYEW